MCTGASTAALRGVKTAESAAHLNRRQHEGFGVVQGVRQKVQVVEVTRAIEGHLGEEVVLDRVGRAVIVSGGLRDLVIVVLQFPGEGADRFGIEAGFE